MTFFKYKIISQFMKFIFSFITIRYSFKIFAICELPSMNISGEVGPNGLNQDHKFSLLYLHNFVRSKVDPPAANMANMTWDPILEAISMHYVEKCALGHNLNRHNEYIQALQITGKQLSQNSTWIGENIAWGIGNCSTSNKYIDCGDIFQGVKRWYEEGKNYDIKNNKCRDQCSLYTQMVWASTTSLGCGAKVCDKNKTILVCNYYPGGNQVKKQPYIIGDPCTRCSRNNSCVENLCTDFKYSEPSLITEIKQTSYIESLKPNENKIEITTQVIKEIENNSIPDGWSSLETKCIYFDIDIQNNIWCVIKNRTLIQFKKSEDIFDVKKIYFSLQYKSISSNGISVWGVVESSNSIVYMNIGEKNDIWQKISDENLIVAKIQTISENMIWVLTEDNKLYYRTDISQENKAGLSWSSIGLKSSVKVMDFSCGSLSCWIVTDQQKIYVRLGIDNSNPKGKAWKTTNSTMSSVYSGYHGYVIAKLTSPNSKPENDLYFWRSGIKSMNPIGSWWFLIKLPQLKNICLGKDIIIATQTNYNLIYTNSFPVEIEQDLNKESETIASNLENSSNFTNITNNFNHELSIVDLLHLYNSHKTPEYPYISTATTSIPELLTNMQKHTGKINKRKKKYSTESPSYYEVSTDYTTKSHKKHNRKVYQTLEESENYNIPTEKKKNLKIEDREKSKEKSFSFNTDYDAGKLKTPLKPHNSKSNNEWLAEETHDIYSCCQVSDSLCAYPEDGCQAYIECDGHNPVIKRCPMNTIFDPYTKVCVETFKTSFHCPTTKKYQPFDLIGAKKIVPSFDKSADLTIPKNINLIFSQNINPENKHYIPRVNGNVSNHIRGALREAWFNLPSDDDSLESLIHDERFPNFPDEYLILEIFEAPPNVGDFYGQRISCYYLAPETGAFVFYLSCDDSCELWIGKNETEQSLEKVGELSSNYSTSYREWNKYPEYQATLYIQLQKNKFYLIEAFMRETRFNDHLSVGVLQPSGIMELPLVSNLFLIPLKDSQIQELEVKAKEIL